MVSVPVLSCASGAAVSRISGLGRQDGVTVAVLVNTRGLTELIALNVGLTDGLIGQRLFTILVLMALITTMMTGPLLTLIARRGGPGSASRRGDAAGADAAGTGTAGTGTARRGAAGTGAARRGAGRAEATRLYMAGRDVVRWDAARLYTARWSAVRSSGGSSARGPSVYGPVAHGPSEPDAPSGQTYWSGCARGPAGRDAGVRGRGAVPAAGP
ncbi:MAG: hypothetical protein ACRDN0_39230 [Trebonia sp.]